EIFRLLTSTLRPDLIGTTQGRSTGTCEFGFGTTQFISKRRATQSIGRQKSAKSYTGLCASTSLKLSPAFMLCVSFSRRGRQSLQRPFRGAQGLKVPALPRGSREFH